jgi:hypothetical protein
MFVLPLAAVFVCFHRGMQLTALIRLEQAQPGGCQDPASSLLHAMAVLLFCLALNTEIRLIKSMQPRLKRRRTTGAGGAPRAGAALAGGGCGGMR